MKIAALKEDLSGSLSMAQQVLTGPSNLTATGFVLISAEQEGVAKITATNIDQTVESWFIAEVSEQGTIALPGKKFVEIIKKLESNTKITLSADSEGKKAILKAGRARFEIPLEDHEHFPLLPKYERTGKISLNAQIFKEMASLALVSVLVEDSSRPVLGGVLVEINQGKISLVATDARRMSYSQHDVGTDQADNLSPELEVRAVIPATALKAILRAADFSKVETIDIALAEKFVAAKCGMNIITSRLLDGDYPDYKRVMAMVAPAASATINAREISVALAQMECMAAQKYAKFLFDEDKLTIEARGGDGLGSGEVVVGAKSTGKIEAVYSLSLIKEFFEALGSDKSAVWQVPSGKTAAAIESGITKYIVMPVTQ